MTKKQDSVLVRGLFHVLGPDNAGKTTFGLTAYSDPSKVCFLDGDASKTRGFAEAMGIGKYVDLTIAGEGLDELGYHKMVMDTINKIEDNKYQVIIYDNMNEFFKGGHTYVATNRSVFRKKWNPMGQIAGAQEWQELRQTHYPRIYSLLKNKAPLVIACTPEKAQSELGEKTGLMEPSADPSLRLAADVIIRLARNTRELSKHAPIGLVIKNTMVYVDGRLKKVFPDRIVPCTWERIGHYLANPVNDREPTQEEMPDEFETHLIMGTLNPEQRELLKYRQRVSLLKIEEDLVNDILDARLRNTDTPKLMLPRAIHKELLEAYPELTVERVQQVLEDVKIAE